MKQKYDLTIKCWFFNIIHACHIRSKLSLNKIDTPYMSTWKSVVYFP